MDSRAVSRSSHGIFTNITHDHLDYHGTYEKYRAAKARLFQGLDSEAVAVVNIDAPDADTGDNLRIWDFAHHIVIDHCSFRRAGDGNVDIWVVPFEGGQAQRLTEHIDPLPVLLQGQNGVHRFGLDRDLERAEQLPELGGEQVAGRFEVDSPHRLSIGPGARPSSKGRPGLD